MKKEYQKPEITEVKLAAEAMLASSDTEQALQIDDTQEADMNYDALSRENNSFAGDFW